MNYNDAGHPAGEASGPRDSNADMEIRRVANLAGSTVAAIWRGQEQLWQRILAANSSAASPRNSNRPVSRGAGSTVSPQVASGG